MEKNCSHVQRFVTFWLPGIVGEIETAQHGGPENGDMARSPQGFEDFNGTLETEVPTSNNHFYTVLHHCVQRIPAVKNSAADIWSIGYYWILTHVRDHFSKMHLNRDLFILKIWRYFDSFRVSAHPTRRRVTRTSAAHQRHVGPCYVSQAGRVPAWRCHMILSYFVQETKETLGGYSTSILENFSLEIGKWYESNKTCYSRYIKHDKTIIFVQGRLFWLAEWIPMDPPKWSFRVLKRPIWACINQFEA